MSTSAEASLRFAFETIEALRLTWRVRPVEDLLAEVLAFLDTRKPRSAHERDILASMRGALEDPANQAGLKSRLQVLTRQAPNHPAPDTLLTDLMRRALLGELRLVKTVATAYPQFADQLDLLYGGTLTWDAVWREGWTRTDARLGTLPEDAP